MKRAGETCALLGLFQMILLVLTAGTQSGINAVGAVAWFVTAFLMMAIGIVIIEEAEKERRRKREHHRKVY